MNKSHFALPLILLTLSSWRSASSGVEARTSTLEEQVDNVSTITANGNIGAKTASATAPISAHDFFVTADLLWWHASEGGTDYAVLFHNEPLSSVTKVDNRKIDFKWNYGFRTGIGTTFHHDKWDLYANFTWFQADNSSASSLHDKAFLVPLLGPIFGDVGERASQVKANWKLQFYNVDLTLGRHYFVSKRVTFHPFIGVKGAWIDQSVRTQSKLFAPVVDTLKSKTTNDFRGVGPSLGVDGKWFLGSRYNFFGSIAGSLLVGEFDVHQKQRLKTDNETTFDVDFDSQKIVPNVQMQIGIGYEKNISFDQYRLAISLRYESQYWWQQNQMPYFPTPETFKYKIYSEDLSLQGLTFDMRLDF